jgi:predicted nucleic acid-binding protein
LTAFVDTNVLLYAVSSAPEEQAKRARAWRLIDGGDLALSVQVLQEFYVQATRPTRPGRLAREQALAFIARWRRFPVQETTLKLLDRAFDIHARHRFSFWDSLILAAVRAQGCGVLLSEDLGHGRIVEGVEVRNPFR